MMTAAQVVVNYVRHYKQYLWQDHCWLRSPKGDCTINNKGTTGNDPTLNFSNTSECSSCYSCGKLNNTKGAFIIYLEGGL